MSQTTPKPLPTTAAPAPPRGRQVDIGGRRLRVVERGDPAGRTLVVCEAGAFGCAANFAVLQDRLGEGLPSLAYDRAGLGYSDPGPAPRDSRAITDDLDRLLTAIGHTGPVVLVGHSMAGVHVQMFALRWPERVTGLVLLDAFCAEALADRSAIAFVKGAQRLAGVARTGAALKVSTVTAPLFGDAVGVKGAAHTEKLYTFGAMAHNAWSADEIDHWLEDAALVTALGELSRELPVASLTAGRAPARWRRLQEEPARRSRSGYVERVAGAGHASLLGPKYGQAVARAVEFVVRSGLAAEVQTR